MDSVKEVTFDMDSVNIVCRDIAVPDASVTLTPRTIDFIGWEINLDSQTVFIAQRNFRTTLHGFFNINLDLSISVSILVMLVPWESRYCLACQCMKAFWSPVLSVKGVYHPKTWN